MSAPRGFGLLMFFVVIVFGIFCALFADLVCVWVANGNGVQ
jgi:hypothetical protein